MTGSASRTVVRTPAFARTMAAVSPFGPEPITYASRHCRRCLMRVLPLHLLKHRLPQRNRRQLRSHRIALPPFAGRGVFLWIGEAIFVAERPHVARRLIGKQIVA